MTLKKSKLEALLTHLTEGGDTSPNTISDVIGVEVEDTETISAYIAAAKKRLAPAEKAEPAIYQLKDEAGLLHTLEVVKQKGSRIILELPVVKDIVTVVIRGEKVPVDLEVLRKLDPNSFHREVLVSTLIAVAELAKG
jgi:hypothetical protein